MVVVTGCFTRESFLSSCQSGGAHAIWNAIGGSPAGKKMEKKEPHCNTSLPCHQSLGKCHIDLLTFSNLVKHLVDASRDPPSFYVWCVSQK